MFLGGATGSQSATVSAFDTDACAAAGFTTWSRMHYAVLSIAATVRRMAGAFVSVHLVEFHLGKLAETFPAVVREMRKAMSADAVAQVLRAMVDEEISIRNLLRVCEVLTLPEALITADLAGHLTFGPSVSQRRRSYRDAHGAAPVLERRLFRVRASMPRYLAHRYARGTNTLVVYLLAPALERRLAHPRPLARHERAALERALRAELGHLPPAAVPPAILTKGSIRLRVRREIAAAFPRIGVVSHQELHPGVNVQPVARIEAPELADTPHAAGRPEADGPS